jgi:hypothetical protein
MRTDDEGHRYERNERNVRGKTEKRSQSILRTVGTGENVGQGYPDCTRIRKHSTSQRSYPCINVSRYKEERMESAESENGQLQRMNAWEVEVRENGMRCIDLSRDDVYGDGDTF